MRKIWLGIMICLIITASSSSQTLFTYGKYSVSVPEFLRAYNKNNTQPATNKARAIEEYLELYINSRLKVREAYEKGYDTLPQIKNELANLRTQIMESYMTDPETMTRLTSEAFARSQKDIHVGHLFIPVTKGDTATAFRAAQAAYNRLKAEDFSKVALEVSQDPSVKTNRGDIGWITVFTLPYAFENVIYALAPGKNSAPVRSGAGYHIFKNLGERKAVGKMKAAQILFAFPPGVDDATKKQIGKKADSIYKRLIAGDDFGKLAGSLSNDYMTAITGGIIPDFGVGQFDPVFESNVWALKKNGSFTKPFQTSHGFHIVKRVNIIPVVTDPGNKLNEQDLRQKVIQDQRWETSRDVIFRKVIQLASLKQEEYGKNILWAWSDSMLDKKPLGIGSKMNADQLLFRLGDSSITARDWLGYAQQFRFKLDGSGRKSYEDLMDEYIHQVAFHYYRDHLEFFNEDFRYQMNEFMDGNLFFEIMQQEIWNRALNDTAELKSLYETNKKKYNWTKSADAVIFFCSDASVAKKVQTDLKKNPANWQNLVGSMSEKVVADSSRFEWTQIPDKDNKVPVNGMVTEPIINETDNTATFAYIIKTYPQPAERSFEEARALVINDYQALLEEQWLQQLRKKYPVNIDKAELEKISK